jgi:CubicO group peptidase (beta-lactamase class C family)
MRKNAGVLLVLLVPGLAGLGQPTGHSTNDSVCALVRRYINEKAVDSLYAMTGPNFRRQIKPDNLRSFLTNNLFPAGELKETSFVKNAGSASFYKAVFSTTVLTMVIGADSLGRLEAFAFQPYKDESAKKTGPIASNNRLSNAQDIKVDSVAMAYMRQLAPVGLIVGVLRDGKTSFYGYGETVKGNGKIPDDGTLFEIGSISKTFTATMLAMAVDQGKLKLDDPVNKYLPDSIPLLKYGGKTATIRMLSNHTSGIPRMPADFLTKVVNNRDPYASYTIPDLYSFLRRLKLGREPGSSFEYSNIGVGLLGTILQKLYGKSYEQLLTGFISGPLGMSDTRVAIRPADSVRFASGYDDKGAYAGPWNLSAAFAGAGAIRSTARDLLKYAAAEMGAGSSAAASGAVSSAAAGSAASASTAASVPVSLAKAMGLTQVITFSDDRTRIGLGWMYGRPGNNDVLFHDGGTGGYRSYLAIDVKKRMALVLLTNCAVDLNGEGAELMGWMERN